MAIINYNTRSVLLNESDVVQLSWLENDVVEGVSPEQAKDIITKLKTPKPERQKFLHSALFEGDLSPTEYNISVSVPNEDVLKEMITCINRVGITTEYNISSSADGDLSYHVNITFFLSKEICANGYYSAATKITNGLIKALGFISPDYRIKFTETSHC